MLEALWSVEFVSSFGYRGNGVAVLETGRVLGGDSIMIYVGSYEMVNGLVHANINVKKYAHAQGFGPVVGLDHFNLMVTGKPGQNEISLTGHVKEEPSRTITLKLVRRAELP